MPFSTIIYFPIKHCILLRQTQSPVLRLVTAMVQICSCLFEAVLQATSFHLNLGSTIWLNLAKITVAKLCKPKCENDFHTESFPLTALRTMLAVCIVNMPRLNTADNKIYIASSQPSLLATRMDSKSTAKPAKPRSRWPSLSSWGLLQMSRIT